MIDHSKLASWKNDNLFRQRLVLQSAQGTNVICNHENCISFSSNDYLGLANHPELIAAFKMGCEQYGVGAGASQVVCGHNQAHQDLETAFATFLKRERALFFANGFMANLGVLSALTTSHDFILQDRKNHASLLDAGKLSSARSQRYLHKNINSLNQYLEKQKKGNAFIVSDGVFSTDGDMALLPELIASKKKYQANLIIDDAHGIGVLGKQGGGISEYFGETADILVCPLGKAFGCYGAIVASDSDTIEMLIQFARTYIYTTAPPPALAVAAKKSLAIVMQENWRREKLQELIHHFQCTATNNALPLRPSQTAIQSIEIDDCQKGLLLKEKLLTQGYLISLLRPPTVEKNKSLLRFTLSASHTKKQVSHCLDTLSHEYHRLFS